MPSATGDRTKKLGAVLLATMILVGLLLASCGPDNGAKDTVDAGAQTTEPTASTDESDPCQLLPPEEIVVALGKPVAGSLRKPDKNGEVCVFYSEDKADEVLIGFFDAQGYVHARNAITREPLSGEPNPAPIDGIGDEAVMGPDRRTLAFKNGDRYFFVSVATQAGVDRDGPATLSLAKTLATRF